jgi:hypothetical protein
MGILPYLILSVRPNALCSLVTLSGDGPATMESVDCWPLATVPIQTLEGKPFSVTVLLGRD